MEMSEKFLINFLKKFDEISFAVEIKGKEHIIGSGEPKFKVKVNKEINKADLLKSTSLALGEAYMRKDIEIEGDLFESLNLFLSQMDKFDKDSNLLKKILKSSTNKKNQKVEVQSHYDIGNDFYKLWLDETLSYSCAYFKKADDTLYEAQMNKIYHILKKLNLKEGMSVLDIGCGWGSLLIEAAKTYKVHGVGITLSEEQYKKFNERIKEENLEEYLEVKIMDYRDLRKSGLLFDRVVSIGMIEHVGRENYPLYIQNVDSVLKEKGIFLLHYISALKESDGDPWIKKYIFPGGVIPSLREIISLCSEYNFYTVDIESLRRHYVKTLLSWNDNFNKNIGKISEKFNEEFIRMWSLYLCSCAASFNNGVIDLHQILITKGVNNDIPLTREYMYLDNK